MYIILLLTLLLALLSLYWLRPAAVYWWQLLSALQLALFVYLYGMWIYGSVYLKYFFGGILLLFFFRRLWAGKKQGVVVKKDGHKRLGWLVLSVILLILNCLYFTGTTGNGPAIELVFPFKSGRYYVLQGGKGLPTNLFHYSLRGAIYAMDIVKLNHWGGRAAVVFSKDLHQYAIFGDTVYSPCNGIVEGVWNDAADNIPPNMQRGMKKINYVLIQNDSAVIFLGHLKQRSIIVKKGEQVKTGQALGCVGNSGFSTEPHLHIQAHRLEAGKAWYLCMPLYIHFSRQAYLLNEVISAEK